MLNQLFIFLYKANSFNTVPLSHRPLCWQLFETAFYNVEPFRFVFNVPSLTDNG